MSSWWERRQRAKVIERKVSWDLFKFQRPLFTTEADPQILAYNSFRTIHFQLPFTNDAAQQELFRGQPKVYAWGRVDREGHFQFDTSREPLRDPKDFPEW